VKWLVAVFVVLWVVVGVIAFKRLRNPESEEAPQGIVTESSVESNLAWLARHQQHDGSWSGTRFLEQCSGPACTGGGPAEDDIELTSLAALSFLGAGYTPQNRASYVDKHSGKTMRFGECVRSAMKFLVAHVDSSGRVTGDGPAGSLRQALATSALCEVYGITNAKFYRAPAASTVAYLESSRATDGMWGDDIVNGESWLAVKSAQISGLTDTAPETSTAVIAWTRSPVERLGPHPTETAYRLLSRIFAMKSRTRDKVEDDAAAVEILTDPPRWEDRCYQHWLVASLALFQFDGPSGPRWKTWNKPMADTLCKHQAVRAEGCLDGSWDGPHGRVRATTEATLMLQIYYRYASVFGDEGH
jgi:hypothetical protein